MALQLFKIAETTVATPQANIEFTSIPQGYTDLMLLISGRGSNNNGQQNLVIRFNDSTSSYSGRRLGGNGSSAYSDTVSGTSAGSGTAILCGTLPDTSATSNTFGNQLIYIPNYTSSNNKTISVDAVSENNSTFAEQILVSGLWSNTSAITKITLLMYQTTTNYLTNSTATLYGIL